MNEVNTRKLYEYLLKQPDNKKLAIVSFFITNPAALAVLKNQWAKREQKHAMVLGRSHEETQSVTHDEFGGSIVLVDPFYLEKGIICEIPVPLAFGLCFIKQNLTLLVTSGSCITKIRGGHSVGSLDNSLYNDLHTITKSSDGNVLIVSTGVDAILEVDLETPHKMVWDWLATEHGYDITPSGKTRAIDRKFDYRKEMIPTPEHTTHINTAINDIGNRVLATLFHQGQLIEIDRASKQIRILISGLKSPHNIRCRHNGFMLSDTRANRVLLLNREFRIETEIKADFNWVQDAIEIEENKKFFYLVCDSNNDRLVLLNKLGQSVSHLYWQKNSRKVSAVEIITASEVLQIFCL